MREIGLDTLLTTRPSLRPGEVVTVLASVARELAGMHAAGRAHGAVSTATVVLDPAGRPRLLHPPPSLVPPGTPPADAPPGTPSAGAPASGAWSAGMSTDPRSAGGSAGAGSAGTAEGDVRALAAVGYELVGPYPPHRLVWVLHEAAAGALSARAVAAKALAACCPEPVRRGPPAADADDDGGGGGPPQPPPSGASSAAPPWERAAPGRPAGEAPRVGEPIARMSAGRGGRWGSANRAAPPPGAAPTAGRSRLRPGARSERPPPRGSGRVVEWWWRLRGGLVPRRRVLVSVLVAVVLGGVVAGWSLAAPSDAARPGTASPAPDDWRGRLERLDRVRAAAYARGDPDALGDVYVPGSRALADDAGTLRAYQHAGLRVRGLRLHITAVRALATSDDEATLAVTDRLDAYQVVDASGRVVRTGAGRPATSWQVTLRRLAGGWRIAAVRAAG